MFEAHPIPTHWRFKDLTGQKFGRLTVISFAGQRKRRRNYWNCLCECGETTVVSRDALVFKTTQSCGCLHRERTSAACLMHGRAHKKDATYQAWKAMHGRCNNPKNKRFPDYGGRGISVCDRWNDFEAFVTDMGDRPEEKKSIDRIDNEGNYEPVNCRWADDFEQANNKRTNHALTHDGITLNLSQWIRRMGISKSAIYSRIKRGLPTEEILSLKPWRGTRHR